jgi:magnesium-protoporphyrin IX monomethyl ester (oxidative) cyclase
LFDFLISRDIAFQKIDDYTTRYGVKDEGFVDFLRRENPDVVGITCPSTAQLPENIRVSRLVKSICPAAPIVVGGPHFSVAGVEYMKDNPQVDIAVVGEGEVAMCEILNSLKGDLKNVSGIIFRENNQVIATKPREFLPLAELLPAYHLWDVEASFALQERGIGTFSRKEQRSVCVITSRGCPYNCIFCSIHLHIGKMWRP